MRSGSALSFRDHSSIVWMHSAYRDSTPFAATSVVKNAPRIHRILVYLYALLAVALTLALRLILTRWMGTGAPYNFFFITVLLVSFFWGAGPGIFSGCLSAFIAAYLFAERAGYGHAQAVAQGVLFLTETGIVSVLVTRLQDARIQGHNALVQSESAYRAQAELLREVRETRRLLQFLMDYSPNTIFIKDLNGAYILVNRKAAEQVGKTEVEMKGKTNFDLFPRPVALRMQAEDEEVLGSGVAKTYEQRIEIKGGVHDYLATKFPYFDESGNLLGVSGIFSDITELKRAEETLRTREAELREAQRIGHIGSWVRNAKGEATFWSDEMFRIFGRDRNSPPPSVQELPRIYTPETMAQLTPAIERLLKDGTPYSLDQELLLPDGTHRWIHSYAEPVRDPSGAIAGFRGVSQEITELKQLQRLREEWTSVIAHDLRQPIGVISMSAGILPVVHEGEMNEKEKRATERIRIAVSSLSRMVDDLLDVSQMESQRLTLHPSWIDPKQFVQDALDRLCHLTAGFEVNVGESGELSPVYADPTRLEQILGNLVSNAAKYGNKGSEIRVDLKPEDEMLRVSVTNQGRGIPEEEIPHLFKRFSRSELTRRSKVPGLGLGLYITKGLVEAHGGRIWVESTRGGTTTFHFTLPTRAFKIRAA